MPLIFSLTLLPSFLLTLILSLTSDSESDSSDSDSLSSSFCLVLFAEPVLDFFLGGLNFFSATLLSNFLILEVSSCLKSSVFSSSTMFVSPSVFFSLSPRYVSTIFSVALTFVATFSSFCVALSF